ncbi:hypothetical protein [Streptomyces sp. NPDC012510]|uniref:hypothetical protein n=1 Tax=Streptomyces sp. NPDC012510 TaxID=3364838 RepID=UPI0036E67ABB
MAVWLWVLFDVLIGAVNGHGWAMVDFGALTIFSISMFSAVFSAVFTRTSASPASFPC